MLNRTRNLILKLWEVAARPDRFSFLAGKVRALRKPVKAVFIEVCGRCNLNCTICPKQSNAEDLDMMSLENFERFAANILPHVGNIHFRGLGEPLLHQHIARMVKIAKSYGVGTIITSNGTLLKESLSADLVDAGLDTLLVSLDAPTKTTYESIRSNARFENVICNLVSLRATKLHKKSLGPAIYLVPVLTKTNIKELPYFISLAKSLGITRIGTSHVASWSRDMESSLALYDAPLPETIDQVETAKREAAQQHLYLATPGFVPQTDTCCKYNPDRNFAVTWDGSVRPCCHLFHAYSPLVYKGEESQVPAVIFGNAFEESFEQIWANDSYVKFRMMVRERNYPAACHNCLMRMGL